MKHYGLLGNNISHSLSPSLHNAAFKELRLQAEYVLFDKEEHELESFFQRMREGEVSGCNVTIPYKEKALQYVTELSAATKAIGALNTVVYSDGSLKGYNTDYQGFMKALKGFHNGDLNFDPEGKSIFVFGAGGAAKAVVYCLKTLGAKKIIIADIDIEKAESLADTLGRKNDGNMTITVVQDKQQYNDFISLSDLLVNATPCGAKASDRDLFDYSYIHERLYVFDLIYARETPLVRTARSQAAKVCNGLNMLLYQAARSFEYWTGKDAPLGVMRQALTERITT